MDEVPAELGGTTEDLYIPDELTYDEEGTAELYRIMNAYLQSRQRGDAIHISDLEAPLKSYWERVVGDQEPYSPREIGYFLVGEGHHVFAVQAVANVDGSQEDSFVDEKTGIVYSPDLVTYNGEFKTSRWFKLPATFEETHGAIKWYYGQCGGYAAFMQDRLLENNTWKLVVLYICPSRPGLKGRTPDMKQYKLRYTDEQLARIREDLGHRAAQLRDAVALRDPSALPYCPENKCTEKVGHGRGYKATTAPICRFFYHCRPPGPWDKWVEENADDSRAKMASNR